MAEVNVNIRGRDDGFGAALDSLREKAQAVGRDVSSISQSNLGSMTHTESRLEVERVNRDTLKAKQEQIRSEFEQVRKSNIDDYRNDKEDFSSGRIDSDQFNSRKSEFQNSMSDLDKEESRELVSLEREMNSNLREILKEFISQKRLESERKQRDNQEFSNSERRDQENQNENGESTIVPVISNSDRDRNNRQLSERVEDGGEGLLSAGQAAAHGNLAGTATGAIAGTGALLGVSKAAMVATAAFGALYGLLDMGGQVITAAGGAGVFRGGARTGAERTMDYASNNSYDKLLGDLGMQKPDFLNMMKEKAQESGSSENLRERTMKDLVFQKGTGADAGVFSKYERFAKGEEKSLDIALDTLNVLTSINRSSLKSTDLSTLQEKLGIQSSIMDIQRSKQDSVNVKDSLRIMAAFESVGMSKMGDRGGQFINKIVGGLGAVGSDNAMLLKYEAAMRNNPELANDPAGLMKAVKFGNADPKQMSETLRYLGDMTKGDKTARTSMIMSMFPDISSEEEFNEIDKMMSGDKGFHDKMRGKGINFGQRKENLDEKTLLEDARSSTGALSGFVNTFKNAVSDFAVAVEMYGKNGVVPDEYLHTGVAAFDGVAYIAKYLGGNKPTNKTRGGKK